MEIIKQIDDKLAEIKASTGKNDAEVAELRAEVRDLMAKSAQSRSNGTESRSIEVAGQFREVLDSKAAELKAFSRTPGNLRIETSIKAGDFLGVDQGSNSPASNFPTFPTIRPGIVDLRRPPTVWDAMPSLPISTASYDYPQYDYSESENHAAMVAEGALKPRSRLSFLNATARAEVLATTFKVSKQALDDVSILQAFMQSKGRQYLGLVADAQVLNGDGTAPNLHGLFNIASAISLDSPAPHPNDRIGFAQATMLTQGYGVNGLVINALDKFAIESERATTGDGQYVSGGVPKFYGLTPLVSAAAVEGTGLVFDTASVLVLERDPISFLLGYSEDDFERNLFTVRIETRLALAVLDTGAVRKVSLA